MINTFYDDDPNSVMTYEAFLSNGNTLSAWFVCMPIKKTIAIPHHILYFVTKYLSNRQPKEKNMLALIEKKIRNVICEFNSDYIIQAESMQEVTEKVIHWKQCMFLISSLCFILGMNGIKNITLPNQCRIQ